MELDPEPYVFGTNRVQRPRLTPPWRVLSRLNRSAERLEGITSNPLPPKLEGRTVIVAALEKKLLNSKNTGAN